MESPAWLPQEIQPSTSQASASDPIACGQSSAPSTPIAPSASIPTVGIPIGKKDGNIGGSDAVASSLSFLYNVPPNNSTSSGSSHKSSSTSVMNSNSPGSSAFIKPPFPVPVVSISSGPSFSYNIPQTEISCSSGPQFQSRMPVASGHSGGAKNISFAAASLQPHVPGQLACPGAFLQGMAAQVMPPPSPVAVPRESSSNAANFSYNGNQQLIQKDTFLPSNATGHVAQGPSVSSVMPVTHSISQPGHSTLCPTSNSASPSYWMQNVPPFQVPPGGSRVPVTPGASNPFVDTHPQGLRLQPGPIGGLSRPTLLPYPSAFPGSYPLPTYGSSVPPSDAQPPGTSKGALGVSSISSVASDSSLETVSGMPPELPPGTDNSTDVNGTGFKEESDAVEQLDSWSAHRTETGAVYYYNAVTGESTYQKPDGFKGELDRVISQPTPISWEKCDGTDWSLVTTNDGKRYYYNAKMKLSSWQIPTEVSELRKRQDGDALKEQSMSVPNTTMLTEKGSAPLSLSAPAVTTGGRDSIALRAISAVPGSSSALDLIKKKLQESLSPAASLTPAASSGAMSPELNGSTPLDIAGKGPHSENGKEKLKDNKADGNLSDSSSDSEDVDSGPTKEECTIQFKEMLKERGVAPFSKWEKELPKIVFDPRFKAIPSYSARRAQFEHFVRTRAEEERKERRAAQKAAIEGYKQLLEEAKEDIDHNTDYQSFKRKWGHDPRFEALDRKEREVLLNERVLPLKKSIEEEVRAKRAAAISSFKSMLRDRGDITTTSRWSKVKDTLRNDPRYKSVKHDEREALFDEYLSELKASLEESEREAKSKRDEEEKLRERERALRKRKEREEQEVERVRTKARRKEAIESYQALLVETIKDPQVTWTDSKPKLEKDPQGRAANPYLDQVDLEKLFREHAKLLHERCAHEFRALLAEVITADACAKEYEDGKTVVTSWSTAKRLLKADPRYTKMPRKDRESLWCRHVEDLQRRRKSTVDEDSDKHGDVGTGSTVGSRKYLSVSRRTHNR